MDSRSLSSQIDAIRATKGGQFKTLVDIGCNFYLQAKVSDTKHIVIDIGCGYFAQMTLDEAQKFIKKRDKLLSECVPFRFLIFVLIFWFYFIVIFWFFIIIYFYSFVLGNSSQSKNNNY